MKKQNVMNKIILLILCFPIFSFAQVQLGQDLDGEEEFDFFGFTTSISGDGNIIAIGAPFNDGNGEHSGHVRVFENQGGAWIQIGEDIDGEFEGDNTGRSVALSEDGSIVAIGADKNDENGTRSGHVRIFKNQDGIWEQVGEDIDGGDPYDFCGESVTMSADGNIVAVGCPGNINAYIRVFRNEGDTWVQIGEDIVSEEAYDFSGGSISMSASGEIIAIGADLNSEILPSAGQVRVYEYQGNSWVQAGGNINGKGESDKFGKAVVLASDASALAISAGGNEINGSDAGYVQVYTYQGGNWVQIGNDIVGEAPEDGNLASSSNNIALTANGKILAIGARHNDGNGQSSGHVRLYENQDNNWVQLGEDIDGEAAGDQSGHSVSLSANGSVLVIGARDNAGTGQDAGHVRVFGAGDLVSSISTPQSTTFTVYPNPAVEQVNIQLKEDDILEHVTIFNNLGQLVYSGNSSVVNVSNLLQGVYSIEVTTNSGRATQNLVIK